MSKSTNRSRNATRDSKNRDARSKNKKRPVKGLQAFSQTVNIVKSILNTLDSPLAWKALCLLRAEDYDGYLSLSFSPNSYLDLKTVRDDYLAVSLIKKLQFPKGTVTADPRAAAVRTFNDAEAKCKSTNEFLRSLTADPGCQSKDILAFNAILMMARRKISSVLGQFDPYEWMDNFGWGPGATLSTSGKWTSVYQKFKKELTVTPNLFPLAQAFVRSCPSWSGTKFLVIPGDEVEFVNKTALTHRSIGVPPSFNAYAQKGLGTMMRWRMKAVGIDLDDQTRNSRWAQYGSRTGTVATVDLKSASDCVAIMLVAELFEPEWFHAICCARSPRYTLDGETRTYEKISAMGNGCTFEIESLIFWALVTSTCEYFGYSTYPVSVYGDDITVAAEAAPMVVRTLQLAGFDTNAKKTFVSGPFRESCGKDYFRGVDIRPVFLKEFTSNAESLTKLANSLRRYAHRCNNGDGCDARFRAAWLDLYQRVPLKFRCGIPEGFGDGGFAINFDEFQFAFGRLYIRTSTFQRRGWERGIATFQLVHSPVKRLMDEDTPALTTLLYNAGKRLESRGVPEDDREIDLRRFALRQRHSEKSERIPTRGYESSRRNTRLTKKILLVSRSDWYDFGPWI